MSVFVPGSLRVVVPVLPPAVGENVFGTNVLGQNIAGGVIVSAPIGGTVGIQNPSLTNTLTLNPNAGGSNNVSASLVIIKIQ